VSSTTRAQAHAKQRHHCSCGVVVRGNGGKASHAAMHARQRTDFHEITEDAWLRTTEPGRAYAARIATPVHSHNGNCFARDTKCGICGVGNVCDVCHEHEQPRGECSECDSCSRCRGVKS